MKLSNKCWHTVQVIGLAPDTMDLIKQNISFYNTFNWSLLNHFMTKPRFWYHEWMKGKPIKPEKKGGGEEEQRVKMWNLPYKRSTLNIFNLLDHIDKCNLTTVDVNKIIIQRNKFKICFKTILFLNHYLRNSIFPKLCMCKVSFFFC